MEPKTFEEGCRQIADELANLVIEKQKDYGQANILDFGEFGVLVRTNDKIARLKNLYKQGKKPRNEALDDSWKDNAGYSIVALMVRRGWFSLPLEEE